MPDLGVSLVGSLVVVPRRRKRVSSRFTKIAQGRLVTREPESGDNATADRGQERVVAKFLSLVNVR